MTATLPPPAPPAPTAPTELARPAPAELAAVALAHGEGRVDPEGVCALAEGLVSWDTPVALATLSERELLDLIAAAERLGSYVASAQRRASAALERRQPVAARVVAADARAGDIRSGRDVTSPAQLRTFRVSASAADEIAMRLGITRPAAARLIGEGQLLARALAPAGYALTAGDLSPAKAAALVNVLRDEDPVVGLTVCEELVPLAPGLTPPEVERRARAAVVRAQPRRAGERHERAKAYRRLGPVRALADGMASLTLITTLTGASTVAAYADAAARAARAAGDERTLSQLRADAVTTIAQCGLDQGRTLITGSASADGGGRAPAGPPGAGLVPPGPSADGLVPPLLDQAFVGRSVRTLRISAAQAKQPPGAPLPPGTADRTLARLGADTETPPESPPGARQPGPTHSGAAPAARSPFSSPVALPGWDVPEIMGSGALDFATARALAQDPPNWLEVVRLAPGDFPWAGAGERPRAGGDSALGRAPSPPEGHYLPSPELRRRVNRAFPTCVAPACDVPAGACQLDHTAPYPAGKTEFTNLKPLCLRHHVLKTHCGHSYTADGATGEITWRTASGHVYVRSPGGVAVHVPQPESTVHPEPTVRPEPAAQPP